MKNQNTQNTQQFPRTDRASMDAFYGKHVLGADGKPTASWKEEHLTLIRTPYPMRLAWDTDTLVTRIRCHKRVAESLERILKNILLQYNTVEAVRAARMDLFGGCYEFRAVRGHNWLSTHAWGAAIDLDPERNGLGVKYNEAKGMMPQAVVRLFEAEGWQWGGLWRRGDAMHFQAAQT